MLLRFALPHLWRALLQRLSIGPCQPDTHDTERQWYRDGPVEPETFAHFFSSLYVECEHRCCEESLVEHVSL